MSLLLLIEGATYIILPVAIALIAAMMLSGIKFLPIEKKNCQASVGKDSQFGVYLQTSGKRLHFQRKPK